MEDLKQLSDKIERVAEEELYIYDEDKFRREISYIYHSKYKTKQIDKYLLINLTPLQKQKLSFNNHEFNIQKSLTVITPERIFINYIRTFFLNLLNRLEKHSLSQQSQLEHNNISKKKKPSLAFKFKYQKNLLKDFYKDNLIVEIIIPEQSQLSDNLKSRLDKTKHIAPFIDDFLRETEELVDQKFNKQKIKDQEIEQINRFKDERKLNIFLANPIIIDEYDKTKFKKNQNQDSIETLQIDNYTSLIDKVFIEPILLNIDFIELIEEK